MKKISTKEVVIVAMVAAVIGVIYTLLDFAYMQYTNLLECISRPSISLSRTNIAPCIFILPVVVFHKTKIEQGVHVGKLIYRVVALFSKSLISTQEITSHKIVKSFAEIAIVGNL